MSYNKKIIESYKYEWRYITMKNMIAYCGLDCENCDAYLATVNND